MKSRNSITIFEKIQKKNKITRRVIALMLVLVVVITTCFASGFSGKKAEAADTLKEPDAYIAYVINEMKKNPARNFVILEIVPDESQGEFIYYCSQEAVNEKISKLTQEELQYIYNKLSDGQKTVNYFGNIEQVYAKDSTGNYVGGTTSNFAFKLRKNALSGKLDIKLENVFLENVIPEYYTFLKDRLEVRCIEANDVTVEDVRTADLIYINSKMHDSTKSAFQVLSVIDAVNNTRGTVPTIYNFAADGTVKSSDPTYADYEFVESSDVTGSEDKIYKDNLAKYDAGTGDMEYIYDETSGVVDRSIYSAEDKADKKFAVYETTAMTHNGKSGYLKSRDISWDVAEELIQLNMVGKAFPGEVDEFGTPTTVISKVPILMDHTGVQSCSDSNMWKMMNILFTVNNNEEIPAVNKATGLDVTLTGWDIIRKMITTELEAYTPGGLRTPLMDTNYYDATINSATTVRDCGKTVSKDATTGKYVVTGNNWEEYIADWDLQDKGSEIGFYKKLIPNDKDYTFVLTDTYEDNGWGGILRWKMFYTLANYSGSTGQGQVYMADNFWRYNGTGALIPVNRFDSTGCVGAEGRIEGIDQWGSKVYPTISIIRYLLGAKNSTDFNPTRLPDGTPATVKLNILEIEPTHYFTYAENANTDLADAAKTPTENIAELLTRINEVTYVHESGITYKPSVNVDADTTNDTDDATYEVNVDAYTVNAVNGLNKDLIAEYDIIYIGVNDYDIGTSSVVDNIYGSGNALYFPQTASVKGNDLTEAKADEIRDFVNAGKILLLNHQMSNTLATTDSNMLKMILDLGIGDNVIMSGAVVSGIYSDRDIAYFYDEDCTPTLTVTSVTVDSTEAPINGDAITYDADGIVTSSGGSSFTVNFEVTNIDPDKDYVTVFYIDENNDGIYGNEPSECRDIHWEADFDSVTTDPVTGKIIIKDMFTRSLPEDFNSALASWKVCVYEEQSGGTEITSISAAIPAEVNWIKRDSACGELPIIKTGGLAEDIRVLHIVDDGAPASAKLDQISAFMTYMTNAAAAIDYNTTVTSKELSDIDATFASRIDDDFDVIVVGMNTYGDLATNVKARDIIIEWVNNDGAIIFTNDLATTMKAEANLTLDKFAQKDTKTVGSSKSYASDATETLNDGPLTQYPYDITGSDIDITATNAQQYQLLLDYVDVTTKTKNEAVVWSTLTSGDTDATNYFYAMYKDAINNPYIYTNSNMTYMGLNSLATSTEMKLLVNAIFRAATQPQWAGGPSIVVNNGIMTAGGYNIYVDIDYIRYVESQEGGATAANVLREQEYIIEFTPRNPDDTAMYGELRWHSDAHGMIVLQVYDGTDKLESAAMKTARIADYKAVLDTINPTYYTELIAEIEAETVDLEIYVKNDLGKDANKHVVFKQRKMYNLK